LINPNRSLVTFVDATELHRDTNKATRQVTLFLFNDKLMVTTRRHSGEDAAALWNEDNTIAQGGGGGVMKKETMKFKGWVDVAQVELFHGNEGNDGDGGSKRKSVKNLLTIFTRIPWCILVYDPNSKPPSIGTEGLDLIDHPGKVLWKRPSTILCAF
jgi:hypothetical protein